MPPRQASTTLTSSPPSTPDFYLDNQWFVQPSLYRITREGESISVGPKVMHVLVCLAQAPGEVVRRDVLMDTVWPDTFVVEEALTRCVSELRKMFGDDPERPRIIETIRNVGYRILAPVSFVSSAAGDGSTAVPPASPSADTSPARRLLRPGRASLVTAGVLALLVVVALAAYQSWRQAEVAAVDPLQSVPVTSFLGEERGGALSPDGANVAFTWLGETGRNVDVYVKTIDGGSPLRLTEDPALDVSPAWSPDGDRVAFMRQGRNGECLLMTVSAAGGSEETVGSCRGNRSPDLAWSPDGSWLAFSKHPARNTPGQITLMSTTGLETRGLTTPPESVYGDTDPAFSPDGSYLAFTRRASAEAQDLYVITLASGVERRLTFDDRLIRGHAWTSHGKGIVFSSNRAGSFGIWTIPSHGGTPSWIAVNGIQQAVNPSTARSSRRLLFENLINEINIRQVELSPGSPSEAIPEPLVVSTQIDVMPHYAPDNNRIAFISNRSGYFELWLAERDGSNPVVLTPIDGPVNGDPQWSPDAERIAFSSLQKQQGDIYVVDVKTGDVRQVTSTPWDEWVPRWSRDGRWIYFTSNRDGSWQIWKVDALGGEPVRITRHGGRAASESTDGRFLFVARSDTAGIWRMPVNGGTATLVVGRTAVPDWGSWVVFEDGIYFINRRESAAAISFFHFDTGEISSQAALSPASLQSITRGMPSLTVSPDRKHAAFAQFDRRERDIVMVESF